MHMHSYDYTYARTRDHLPTHAYAYTHTYTYMYKHAHTHMHMHACRHTPYAAPSPCSTSPPASACPVVTIQPCVSGHDRSPLHVYADFSPSPLHCLSLLSANTVPVILVPERVPLASELHGCSRWPCYQRHYKKGNTDKFGQILGARVGGRDWAVGTPVAKHSVEQSGEDSQH